MVDSALKSPDLPLCISGYYMLLCIATKKNALSKAISSNSLIFGNFLTKSFKMKLFTKLKSFKNFIFEKFMKNAKNPYLQNFSTTNRKKKTALEKAACS